MPLLVSHAVHLPQNTIKRMRQACSSFDVTTKITYTNTGSDGMPVELVMLRDFLDTEPSFCEADFYIFLSVHSGPLGYSGVQTDPLRVMIEQRASIGALSLRRPQSSQVASEFFRDFCAQSNAHARLCSMARQSHKALLCQHEGAYQLAVEADPGMIVVRKELLSQPLAEEMIELAGAHQRTKPALGLGLHTLLTLLSVLNPGDGKLIMLNGIEQPMWDELLPESIRLDHGVAEKSKTSKISIGLIEFRLALRCNLRELCAMLGGVACPYSTRVTFDLKISSPGKELSTVQFCAQDHENTTTGEVHVTCSDGYRTLTTKTGLLRLPGSHARLTRLSCSLSMLTHAPQTYGRLLVRAKYDSGIDTLNADFTLLQHLSPMLLGCRGYTDGERLTTTSEEYWFPTLNETAIGLRAPRDAAILGCLTPVIIIIKITKLTSPAMTPAAPRGASG